MKKFIYLLLCFISCLAFSSNVQAYYVYPEVSTLSVNYTNSVGGGGNNVRHFSTTPPVYANINKFIVTYSGETLFGILEHDKSEQCASVSFGVTAPTDYRLSNSYNTLSNWSMSSSPNVFTSVRYVDVYYSNSKYYYTFYFSTTYTSTQYLVHNLYFDYTGSSNPFYTNQNYTFDATTPVSRFVDCSSISENMISSEIDELHKEIDNKINSVNSNIDSMKDKQEETNNKLDEANQTSKGILGKIGDLITGIPNWFGNLANSIGEFFSNLISSMGEFFTNLASSIGGFFSDLFKGIEELFMGKEECSTGTTTITQVVNPVVFKTNVDFTKSGEINKTSGQSSSAWSRKSTDYIPLTTFDRIYDHDNGTFTIFYYDSDKNYLGYQDIQREDIGSTRYFYYANTKFVGQYAYIRIVGHYQNSYTLYLGKDYLCMEPHEESVEVEEETCARKGGLFGIINDFKNAIGNWFKELLSGILEGIKALFVPTDEQLYEIIDDSKELTENFGFVGESVSFFITIFTSLLGLVNANGCVELPEFSIGETTLFESHKFWDKQVVCLNDNTILSSNITTIRTITSIVLVCMFINFAASKFFTILSKNDFANDTSGIDYSLDDNTGVVTRTEHWTRGSSSYRRKSRY